MKILQTVLESNRPKFNEYLKIHGSFVWLSDFEIPYHNAKFINQVFTISHALGIRQCVWGGDAFHLEAFSPFGGADHDADQEISEIDEYLPGFLEPFDKIWFFVGNHDQRLIHRLNDIGVMITNKTATRMLIAPETALEFKEKVTLSEYRYAKAGKNWLLEHPKNASTIPGRTAQQLSAKFHCHTLVGHTHNAGKTMFNGFYAIETGHCLDSERLAYNSTIHSTRPQMAQGAVLMWWDSTKQDYNPIDLTPQTINFYLSSIASNKTRKATKPDRPNRIRSKR